METQRTYKRRLDSLYHYLAMYVVGMVAYILFKGRIEEGSFTFLVSDPILILFTGILLFVLIYLFWSVIESKEIVLTDQSFIYRTRFREVTYPVTDILWMKAGFERGQDHENRGGIIRMKIRSRRSPLVIRPRNYERSEDLKRDLADLRKKVKALTV